MLKSYQSPFFYLSRSPPPLCGRHVSPSSLSLSSSLFSLAGFLFLSFFTLAFTATSSFDHRTSTCTGQGDSEAAETSGPSFRQPNRWHLTAVKPVWKAADDGVLTPRSSTKVTGELTCIPLQSKL